MSSGGVMLTGWLRKSPPENKLKSRHHSWKKRWFVLKSGRLTGDPNVLEYSKYHTSKKPIKIIDLNNCQQIDINVNVPVRGDKKDKDASQHFIFSIVTSHRTFYLIADSKREMSSWVQCLCDLCGFNYDSTSDKDSIGDKQRTFMASPTSLVVHSPGGSVTTPVIKEYENESSVHQNAEKVATPHYSKTQYQNGNVNTSFRHSSNNGYDSADQEGMLSRRDRDIHNGTVHYHNNIGVHPPKVVMEPPHSTNSTDSAEYLHLVDCETAPGSTLQLIDKGDQRRCSTDSVFTRDDDNVFASEDSKPHDELPDLRCLPPRFLEGTRLDSMPNVPPPAPPIGVDALENNGYDDDEVVDARRTSKYSQMHRGIHGYQENPYNVPARAIHKTADDFPPWQGRSGSFGSAKQLHSSEYMNTLGSAFSSTISTSSVMLESPICTNDPHSISSSASSRLINGSLNPMSPVFPMTKRHGELTGMHHPNSTLLIDNTQMLDVLGDLERQEMENWRTDQIPPARPPKPSDLLLRNNHSVVDGHDDGKQVGGDFNGHVSPRQVTVIGTTSDQTSSEAQSLLLPNTMPGYKSLAPPLNMTSQTPAPTSNMASPEDPDTSIYDMPKPNIYDTPRALLPNLRSDKETNNHATVSVNNIDIGLNPVPCDDVNFYTPMAGATMPGPRFPTNSPSIGLLDPPNLNSMKSSPPPVHRDLKPGRKSLGSDGGSSHSGQDMRKNSGRDSFTSDEGLSPPHTAVIPSPQVGDRNFPNLGQSPLPPNGGSLSSRHISSRSPRLGSNLPPSPLVSPNSNQPVRSPTVPKRPPKPASMKSLSVGENIPTPPRRPPKPGETQYRNTPINPTPSAIVGPPYTEEQPDIKYIEIITPHPHPMPSPMEKIVDNDLVEYTDIDRSKTQALEKSKKEWQGKMFQKSNPD